MEKDRKENYKVNAGEQNIEQVASANKVCESSSAEQYSLFENADEKRNKKTGSTRDARLAEGQFPLLLGESKLRPRQLFCRGTLPPKDAIGIAMVGTRRPSNSAKELCRRLVESLRGTNAVVVSGLAQGIDSYCHEAALNAGIPTVAVIAQGLDAHIPGERAVLAQRIIAQGGAILSEYEGDAPCYKGTFPARNRIISGLCKATVLVQSKAKGGALITADYCLQEGKLLLAVPGDFDSEVASGPNLYLDQGKAKPIFNPDNLWCLAGLSKNAKNQATSLATLKSSGCDLSAESLEFFNKYSGFRKTFSDFQAECNLKTNNILAILTELEIAGLVTTRDNFQFLFSGTI